MHTDTETHTETDTRTHTCMPTLRNTLRLSHTHTRTHTYTCIHVSHTQVDTNRQTATHMYYVYYVCIHTRNIAVLFLGICVGGGKAPLPLAHNKEVVCRGDLEVMRYYLVFGLLVFY